jgi:hypothetical protein
MSINETNELKNSNFLLTITNSTQTALHAGTVTKERNVIEPGKGVYWTMESSKRNLYVTINDF